MANNRPKGFGYTAETTQKLDAKYKEDVAEEAMTWINAVLGGNELGGLKAKAEVRAALCDGIVLCRLMNTLKPGSITKIHPATANNFKKMENINNFLTQAESYGCQRGDLFQSVYLTDSNQNFQAVILGIHALGRAAQKNGFNGPVLGPKEADVNPREFSDEQLMHGRVHGI